MRTLFAWVAAFLLCGTSPPAAFAQSQSSIADLLKQGYEIKATLLVPLQDVKASDTNAAAPQVLITLQKGPSIAVCQFAWTNWAALASVAKTSFTAADRCDVR